MAEHTFTAEYGVEFGEHDPKTGEYAVWAKFGDPVEVDGRKVFSFATDDSAVADRVRKADGYGVVETSKAKPRKAETA